MNTRCIAVVDDGYVVRKTVDKSYLLFGQRRTAAGNDILNTRLVERNDIHLPFDQVTAVFALDSLLGKEHTVQLARLRINDRVGRIDVLARVLFLLEYASRERHGLAGDSMNREDDSVAKTVVQSAVLRFAD